MAASPAQVRGGAGKQATASGASPAGSARWPRDVESQVSCRY